MSGLCINPSNPNAQDCVRNVLRYLSEISFRKVISGQHTQSLAQEELHFIEDVTGKKPALLGFELLSYSPNINYFDTDDECMEEIRQNYGTLSRAWDWAAQKGLITFTWHWFSPLGGHSKSFYSKNTSFDAEKAAAEGTEENRAMISDIDAMAGILRPFCDARIPVLWRPLHEGDGGWFWWGAKGGDALKKIYRILYDRFVNVHHLDNLIWVWNSHEPSCYPGDDVVDIISRDIYGPPHEHSPFAREFSELVDVTAQKKIVLLGECGTMPDAEKAIEDGIGWASFMTWSHEFCLSEQYNDFSFLRRIYSSEKVVTKESLPALY